MSDQEHDQHEAGGHEIDKMPSQRLFKLLFGLSALTLVACILVVQMFYRQVSSIRAVRDAKTSFQLAEYRTEMDELVNQWGTSIVTDDDGVPESEGGKGVHEVQRVYMPLSEARKRVLEEPQKYLKADRPYRGWRNPDAKAPKAPTQKPTPAPSRALPGGVAPTGVQPAKPTPLVMPTGDAPAPAEANQPRGAKAAAPKPSTPIVPSQNPAGETPDNPRGSRPSPARPNRARPNRARPNRARPNRARPGPEPSAPPSGR